MPKASLKEINHRQETAAPVLRTLYIYMTEECNLSCSHCWIAAKREKTTKYQYPNLTEYVNLIKQAITLGLKRIKISGGEPMLRSDVYSLIEFASSNNINTMIETNGTLLDEEGVKILKRTKSQLAISLDGSSSAIHDRMRGTPGAFDRAMVGLELLQKHAVPVQIVTALSRMNVCELPGILDLATKMRERTPLTLKINPVIASGRAKKLSNRDELLGPEDLLWLAQKVELEYSVKYRFPIVVQLEPAFHSLNYMLEGRVGGGRCQFLNLLGILANGDVSFCGMGYSKPEFLMGHARGVDLVHLWREARPLMDARTRIPHELEGVCGKCIFKYTCQGGCRAYAIDKFGSITAPSPYCQSLYEHGHFPKNRLLEA